MSEGAWYLLYEIGAVEAGEKDDNVEDGSKESCDAFDLSHAACIIIFILSEWLIYFKIKQHKITWIASQYTLALKNIYSYLSTYLTAHH